jgi:hypothetical protein
MANCDPPSLVLHRFGALVLGATLSLGLGTACGDDIDPPDDGSDSSDGEDDGEDDGSACADTEVEEFPEGQYGRPEEVIAEGIDCPEGGLADVDLTGRWSFFLGGSSFSYQYPYVRESCEDGFELGVEIPGGEPLIHRDDTNVFIRSEDVNEEYSYVVAARVCAGPSPDELSLVVAQCFAFTGEEPECLVGPGVMKRFGRPEGEVEAEGLELVAEWSGGDAPWPQATSANVKVADGVAFLSRLNYLNGDEASDLRLIDVAKPEAPADLGSFSIEKTSQADFNDVKLLQLEDSTYAVLSGSTSPIIDATDPTAPVLASNLEYSHSMFLREDAMGRPLAYLANAEADVPIYDLSDPTAPVLLERVETPPRGMGRVGVHDLYAEEDRLYLNGEGAGFYVMDREGADWTVGGNLPTGGYNHANWVGEIAGRKISVMGDEGYGAHLQVVDVDPASKEFMTVIGEYQTRPEAGIHNIMLFGTRAYVAYYHDGVRIIDLADPTDPQLVAYYHTWDPETGSSDPFAGAIGIDVDVEAGLIYVADMERGLMILRETK